MIFIFNLNRGNPLFNTAMKNIDKLLFLPLFAALAIGCSSPTAMQSSEYDDVYYSSKDKTIILDKRVADNNAAENPEQAQAGTDAAADGNTVRNPEYSGNNSGTAAANEDYYSENYYSEDDYAYASRIRRFNAPYRGFSYYDAAYTDYYWYNRSPIYYGRSTFYDPFFAYDPFFPCYTCYGFPPMFSGINIVIGRPFYGGWGNPFNPFGYYGGYGFNQGGFGFNNGFNNGFYNRYYANNGLYRNDNNGSRDVQYGRRRDRSEVPAGTNTNTGNRPRGVNSGGGGIVNGGSNPGGGIARPSEGNTRSTRARGGVSDAGTNNADPALARPTDTQGRSTRGRQERSTTVTQPDGSNNLPTERAGRREVGATVTDMPNAGGRREVNQPTVQPQSERTNETYSPAPQPERRQRREMPSQPQPTEQQPSQQQPQRQRTYEAPQRQERTYEAPRRQEPSYQAPQRQERTYEQPSSRPSPSSSGGSSSGGGSRRRD